MLGLCLNLMEHDVNKTEACKLQELLILPFLQTKSGIKMGTKDIKRKDINKYPPPPPKEVKR